MYVSCIDRGISWSKNIHAVEILDTIQMTHRDFAQEKGPSQVGDLTQESTSDLNTSTMYVNDVNQWTMSVDKGNAYQEIKFCKRNRCHGKSPYCFSISDRKKQPSGMSPYLWKQVADGPIYRMTVYNRRTDKSYTTKLTPKIALDMIEIADKNLDENKQINLTLEQSRQEERVAEGDSKNKLEAKGRVYSDRREYLHMVQLHFTLFHPNIVKILEIYVDSKFLILFPSYCGLSIYERICARGETFKDQLLINLIRTLFSVLEFIHNKGFIHRNIRPTNICLDDNGNLFLVGFDFCTNIEDSNMLEIDHRSIGGSPEYVSPELCQQIVNADDKRCGSKPRYKDVQISGKSDTYAVGMTISFICKKEELLQPGYLNTDETCESNDKFILEIAEDPGHMKKYRPDDMPQDWKNVADHCLEGDASKRYHASKVLELLQEMEKKALGNKHVSIECKLEKRISIKQKLKEKIHQKSDTGQSATQQEHNLPNTQDGKEHLKVEQQTVPSNRPTAKTNHQVICQGLKDKINNRKAGATVPDPGIQTFSSASVRISAESLHGDITNHTLGRPPPESNNIPDATVLPLPSTEDIAGRGLEPVIFSDVDIPISRIPTIIFDHN